MHLTPFASAAAEASGDQGGVAAARPRGHDTSSSGAATAPPCDIGFSGVSAAAERNEDIIYVLNDNEAYMNTGVQKSGATPEGAWTTTTPAGAPRAGSEEGHRPDHGGARDSVRRDARRWAPCRCCATSERRSREPPRCEGFRFLHVLGACPPGWRYPTAQSTEIARLAVESRYFPLFECDDGEWRITFRPKHPVPVSEFLETQGRFSHLSPEEIDVDPVPCRRALGAARRPGVHGREERSHDDTRTAARAPGRDLRRESERDAGRRDRASCRATQTPAATGPSRSPGTRIV